MGIIAYVEHTCTRCEKMVRMEGANQSTLPDWRILSMYSTDALPDCNVYLCSECREEFIRWKNYAILGG